MSFKLATCNSTLSTDGPAWCGGALVSEVIRLARAALPCETAGFFVRRQDASVVLLPLAVRATPRTFEARPEELVQTIYALAAIGGQVIGTYHSHPAPIHAFSREDERLFEWGTWHLLVSGVTTEEPVIQWAALHHSTRSDRDAKII